MSAATLSQHWQVLKDSWALESQNGARRKSWKETDFLPAALEVVETPPHPLGRALLWTLLAFVAAAFLWSLIAKVDVVAVAPAKLIAADRNKLVQAADGGVVRAIHVRDGERVKAGQLLVELDPTTAGADEAQAESALLTARIDVARSRALLSALDGGAATFVAPTGAPAATMLTQRTLISARLAEVDAKTAALREAAEEARAQIAASMAEAARLNDTLPLLVERVERRRILTEKGLSSKLLQLELDQQKIDHERRIAIEGETARRARATLAGIGQQIAEARATARREALADLAQAEAEVRQREEELTKAGARRDYQALRSPVDGVVQQLAVYTIGAVVKPADPILVVVPSRAQLVVEANILNRDIGFVEPGQSVSVKFEAFPFTRYGTVEGQLTQLSRDAIQDEKLGPVYSARILLDRAALRIGERWVPLSPGLNATAEIKTDTRRVVDFLLSPIERRLSESGRER